MKEMLLKMINEMSNEECEILNDILQNDVVLKEDEIVKEFVYECGFDDEQLLRNVIKKLVD